MDDELSDPQRLVEELHAQEEREKEIARHLPEGEERDEHWMRGERLSDRAWSIEEEHDVAFTPSGVWRPR